MNTITKADRRIELHDGRKLWYTQYGDPEGKPVFFMHGFPGSRLDWQIFDPDNIAAELHARIIAIDRPGIGLSDHQRGRELLDWPNDVAELMNALGFEQSAVLALSGGGPYGMACAYKIPERLSGAAIVCGMGPADAPGAKDGASWTIPGKNSLMRRLILFMMAQGLQKDPEKMEPQFLDSVSRPDRELLESKPELLKQSIGSWHEAFRAGIKGIHQEASLYTKPWGFRLQEIQAKVHLWQGEDDNNVPGSVGHYLAEAIPDCRAKFYKDEGHFSLAYNHMREFLSVLVSSS
jgi:pimeloyl-ACP methyl ester carboxylesterase